MNKGFTLVELMGVFIIMSILFLIVAPLVNSYVAKAEEAGYERQIENIVSGAKGWAAQNLSILPTEEGSYITIYLGELKLYELIDKNIVNPVTDVEFYNDMEIVIKRKNNTYEYLVKPDTGTGERAYDDLSPTIFLNGSSTVFTEINEEYLDEGVFVRDRFGKRIFDYRTIVKSNGIVVSELDTSRLAMYTIQYEVDYVIDNEAKTKTASAVRTVEVVDTTPPLITTPGDVLLALSEAASFNAMTGVSVVDNSLENLTITTSGNYSAIPGVYNITYTATDSSGNMISVMRRIEVVAPQWTFEVTIPAGSLNFAFAAVSSSLEIEWGDSQTSPFVGTGYPTHNYAAPGVYEVTLKGNAQKISFCTTGGWSCPSATPTKLTDILTVIPVDFGITDASFMFARTIVTSFSKIDFFDEASANVTTFRGMFDNANNFNHPIGNWNTSKVTDLLNMFNNALAFNQPIGNWDTSKVTNMYGTFQSAIKFNQSVGDWNTSNVTSMECMFCHAYEFNQPVGNWDTAKVTTMRYLFNGATKFNQPLSNFNTSNVTNMNGMFYSASAFNQSVTHFNVSKVTDMGDMFASASAFDQPLTGWNTSNVTYMYNMFRYSLKFNRSLAHFDTSKVTSMGLMFNNADMFNQPIGNWNTSSVTNMSNMFRDADEFNQPIGNWNTSNVTNMSFMFGYARKFNQPIGNWDTSSVTNMSYMLLAANAFNQSIENWNTSNVTDMSYMFQSAWSFNQPIGNWDTSNVTNMSYMFNGANWFNQNIGSWNTSKVTNMISMFDTAQRFNQNLSSWCVSLIASQPSGFQNNAVAWVLPKPIWGTCP